MDRERSVAEGDVTAVKNLEAASPLSPHGHAEITFVCDVPERFNLFGYCSRRRVGWVQRESLTFGTTVFPRRILISST
jgi:hypothetical protein